MRARACPVERATVRVAKRALQLSVRAPRRGCCVGFAPLNTLLHVCLCTQLCELRALLNAVCLDRCHPLCGHTKLRL